MGGWYGGGRESFLLMQRYVQNAQEEKKKNGIAECASCGVWVELLNGFCAQMARALLLVSGWTWFRCDTRCAACLSRIGKPFQQKPPYFTLKLLAVDTIALLHTKKTFCPLTFFYSACHKAKLREFMANSETNRMSVGGEYAWGGCVKGVREVVKERGGAFVEIWNSMARHKGE